MPPRASPMASGETYAVRGTTGSPSTARAFAKPLPSFLFTASSLASKFSSARWKPELRSSLIAA